MLVRVHRRATLRASEARNFLFEVVTLPVAAQIIGVVSPPKLLALDLDGTLVRSDGTIAPEDRDAVKRAQDRGVVVTIVTGRIGSGAAPVARELAMEGPIVCADGAQLVDPASLALLEHDSVPPTEVNSARSILAKRDLAPFALTHDAIHGPREAAALARFVRPWSPELRMHETWPDPSPVGLLLGIGARDRAALAKEELASTIPETLACDAFPLTAEMWAVRVQSRASSKGRGLRSLAARLGVDRGDVAFVGDWYNDVSAFAWAGRSFCMGHAPPAVSKHAKEVLRATSWSGGGVAEVARRWW